MNKLAQRLDDFGPALAKPVAPMLRCGLTLVELLLAISIMSMMAAAIGALSVAVQMSSEHALYQNETTQHGRVALERMLRAVRNARANQVFPGVLAIPSMASTGRHSDVLAVWHPADEPVSPEGLPRFNELVVFMPDPDAPNRLLELTFPDDHREVPPVAVAHQWHNELVSLAVSPQTRRVQLTDRLKTGVSSSVTGAPEPRGVVWFSVMLRPSEEEWGEFKAGDLGWNELTWAQSLYGTDNGLRQVWCSIELQLDTPIAAGATQSSHAEQTAYETTPFFGSATRYYMLRKE